MVDVLKMVFFNILSAFSDYSIGNMQYLSKKRKGSQKENNTTLHITGIKGKQKEKGDRDRRRWGVRESAWADVKGKEHQPSCHYTKNTMNTKTEQ